VAFTIKVTDSANQSVTQSYTISILAESARTLPDCDLRSMPRVTH
jgi:hypothetical protein